MSDGGSNQKRQRLLSPEYSTPHQSSKFNKKGETRRHPNESRIRVERKLTMKFTIDTKALADALNVAAVAIMNRTTLPILGNVKIEAGDSTAIFSASDLDLWVTAKRPAESEQTGAITVPFDLLHSLVARLRSTQTEFELVGKELHLRSGEVNAIFETLPADEFPPAPPQNKKEAVECSAKDLREPFSKLSHAMSKDSSSYALMGINVSGNGNGSAFVATNRRRLALFKGVSLTKDNIIIPDVLVRAFLKIDPTGDLKVIIGDGLISVVASDSELICKLVEAKYPNWETVVPDKSETFFSCDRKDLIEALRTCAVFSERETQALSIVGKGKEIEVFKDDKIKARILGTELAGQPKLTVRFNFSFMLDALNVLENQNVRIQCGDGATPMLIEEGAFKSVVMPMAQ